MDNEKFQELVLQQLQVLTENQKKLTEGQQQLSEKVGSLTEGQQQLTENQKKLTEGQNLLTEKVGSLTEGQKKLEERITKLENVVIRIENDHGRKLAALLDGYHHNAEILDDHTERLTRIESKITAHDIQISILDKTKSNKRKAK